MASRRFHPDYFLLAILTSAVLASFLPAAGVGAAVLSWGTKVAIFLLFFLYGARLHPHEALNGLKHWRLHLTILAFTFVVFPLVGLLIAQVGPHVISTALLPGVMYLTLCPSTVQSSINFTSIARGNVAGAIVSASASNLLGVFITPLLAVALMNTSGHANVGLGAIFDLMAQILLPFVLGQISRRWTADFVARHKRLKLFDQGSIVLVVYSAFSEGVREGIWTMVDLSDLLALLVLCLVMLAVMLTLTWFTARQLGFSKADAVAIQFCGTKKSLTTGLPMATVLFIGQPIGFIMLPLMAFHQAQLMACSWLAARYSRRADEPPATSP